MMPLNSLLRFQVVVCVLNVLSVAGALTVNDPNTIEVSCKDKSGNDDSVGGAISSGIASASDDGHESTHCRDDRDDCLDRSMNGLCETAPLEMLLRCRKSCLICPQVGVEQNVGLSDTRVPMSVSIDMLHVVRETNHYYRTKILNDPPVAAVVEQPSYGLNALSRRNCQNQHELCSLWKLQNRCSSPEYGDFVRRECPLACQLCHTEEYRARSFLELLSKTLPEVYYSTNSATESVDIHQEMQVHRNMVNDRFRTLSHLMSLLGMDPGLLNKPLVNYFGNEEDTHSGGAGFNWLQELNSRITAVIPSPLLRLYYDASTPLDDTTNTENRLKALLAPHNNHNKGSIDNILVPYRHRGYVFAPMLDFDHFITRPIQLAVGFAVPNEAALKELESLGPLLQMGAGTGYWTALLRFRGVDIVAFDLHPPAGGGNAFFDVDYSNGTIEEGDCMEVLSRRPALAQGRTLLMIWPNDPDPIDNPDFCDSTPEVNGGESFGSLAIESEPVWDTACLMAYMQAGGEQVVYVGEREEIILGRAKSRNPDSGHSSKPDSGLSGTRAFQQTLQSQFELVNTVELPNWWLNEDDMTIWRRIQQ
jgi:hypothetical protein